VTAHRGGFWSPVARRIPGQAEERGSAIIEFVFVTVIVLLPLIYVVVAAAAVQHSQLAVSQAAREAGRAYATSDSPTHAAARALAAARISLADQHLEDGMTLRYVGAGASCSASEVAPQLVPGAEFTVCVIRHTTLPAIPSILAGQGITSVGQYVVHVDDYRTVAP
jgi:Flp pilus assembly protein TadG